MSDFNLPPVHCTVAAMCLCTQALLLAGKLQNDMICAINSPSTTVDLAHHTFHAHLSSSYLIHAFSIPLHSTLLMCAGISA